MPNRGSLPNEVTAYRTAVAEYPTDTPFHPDSIYPEYEFGSACGRRNAVYAAVRDCFIVAGLDAAHVGKANWNPLATLIEPGETVLLKPNLVKEKHPRDPQGWKYVLTHGSVIRAVADYAWKALRGHGTIIIADAPQTDSSFNEIVRVLGLDHIRQFYSSQGLVLELADLRQEEWETRQGVTTRRRKLAGDPRGVVAFDLAGHSEFVGHPGAGHYYGADYDSAKVNRHHSGGRHEYLIAGAAIHCDVLFNLPKIKTHKKAGITVSLKNLVGINADKNWLPHHTESGFGRSGDEHPNPTVKHRIERKVATLMHRIVVASPTLGTELLTLTRKPGIRMFGDTENVIRSGNWWGNDTIWRMCLDLNKLVLYGNSDGTLRADSPHNRKRHFVMADGIIAGEGRGPMNPDPVNAGLLVFGSHPPSVDAVCAYLMGFDPDRIPIVRQAFSCRKYPLGEHSWRDVRVTSNVHEWNQNLTTIPDDATFHFEPHFGWKGKIERLN